MNPAFCPDEANTVGMWVVLAAVTHLYAVLVDDLGLPGDRIVNKAVGRDVGHCCVDLTGFDLIVDSPLSDVHKVYAVSANKTRGVVGDVVPVADLVTAGDALGAKRCKWRRAQPQVVIEVFRYRYGWEVPPCLNAFVNPNDADFHADQPPDPSVANQLADMAEGSVGPALQAGLQDPAVAFCDFHQTAALSHGKRKWFFYIHILTGLHSHDRHRCVPMVRRADADGVDILAGKQIAEVTIISANSASIVLINVLPESLAPGFYRIANSNDTSILLGQKNVPMVCVDITRSDQAQSDSFAWRDGPIAAEYTRWYNVRKANNAGHAEDRVLKKVASRCLTLVHLMAPLSNQNSMLSVRDLIFKFCLDDLEGRTIEIFLDALLVERYDKRNWLRFTVNGNEAFS